MDGANAYGENPAAHGSLSTMTTTPGTEDRLPSVEERLERLERILVRIDEKLQAPSRSVEATKQWVVDYVSACLQSLVPGACEHPEEPAGGPFLTGTKVRCTAEVAEQLKRIPIPFVRGMVAKKVAEAAAHHRLGVVDLDFYKKSATF